MAENTKKANTDVEDIDLSDIETGAAEDVVETTLNAKAKDEAKKAPKSNLPSIQPLGENEVGVAYIAEITGLDQRAIRGYLRSNFRDMDASKGQRYRWEKGSAELQSIIDGLKNKPEKTKKVKETAVGDASDVASEAMPEETIDDLDIESIE